MTCPLFKQSLVQPYSLTSLLQEVFLVKQRPLRHQCVSQKNALSVAFFCDQTNPVCLGALSHLERLGFAFLQAGAGWMLAGCPGSNQQGREARLLSLQRCISHQNAHACWQRVLCCGISPACWRRRWLSWDSAGSAMWVLVQQVKCNPLSVLA